jgi:hypothetical protein
MVLTPHKIGFDFSVLQIFESLISVVEKETSLMTKKSKLELLQSWMVGQRIIKILPELTSPACETQ